MINKIKIHNFQCHRDLELELGRSTVLQGGSNHGKTAVLRAFYWVLYNEAPHDFVSYWAQKKTKSGFTFKDDEYTSVIVEVDGHVIERKRSKSFNGYIVDGTVFEALGTDVPEDVTKIFNLSDASVQQQFDSPFLLSKTGGDASRYLNALAGLECVDDILTIAKRKVAEASEEATSAKESVEALEKETRQYAWVPVAENLLGKADRETSRIDELRRSVESLGSLTERYKAIKDYPTIPSWLENGDRSDRIARTEMELGMLRKYVDASRVLERVTPVLDRVGRLHEPKAPKYAERDMSALVRSIREYRSVAGARDRLDAALSDIGTLREPGQCKHGETLPKLKLLVGDYAIASDDCDAIAGYMKKLSALKAPEPCKWTEKDMSALVRSIREYRSADRTLVDSGEGLEEAYASLDGVACPVCGRPLSRDACML